MAVLKCPECGRDVSSTLDACPHCGYKMKNEKIENDKETNAIEEKIDELKIENNKTEEKDEDIILVVRRDRLQSTTAASVTVGIGILLIPIIFGIILAIIGGMTVSMINKNNSLTKELIYFDKKNRKFILYDVNNNKIICPFDKVKSYVKFNSGYAVKNSCVYKQMTSVGLAMKEDIVNITKVIESY